LENLEIARVQAERQVRYLNLAVTPVAPDITTYPRKLENTLLAIVIFFGLYIFLSLTVSVLREQVNA
jgi:capsular polysaccharide transport system permease protein